MRATLDAPPGFVFRRTVHSHGWCTLAPFRVDRQGDALDVVVCGSRGGARRIRLRASPGGVRVETPGPVRSTERRHLLRAVRRVLNLDLDLGPFHDRVRGREELDWMRRCGTGRLLRAPNLFEDLIKLVLTTNCSWSLTQSMVRGLVEAHGETTTDGERSFPLPHTLAGLSEGELRDEIRVGYRAPFLLELSRAVANGEIDPESWERAEWTPERLRPVLLELPGVGPYVAENLLKFLGRPDGLALDSWLRAKYAQVYHEGRRVSDRTIARRYACCGEWAGLALWCDMTRDWFVRGRPTGAWSSLS